MFENLRFSTVKIETCKNFVFADIEIKNFDRFSHVTKSKHTNTLYLLPAKLCFAVQEIPDFLQRQKSWIFDRFCKHFSKILRISRVSWPQTLSISGS